MLRRGCAVEEQIHEPVRLVFQRTSPHGAQPPATAAPRAGAVDVEAALARAQPAAGRGRSIPRGEGRRALLEATVRLIARYGTDGVTYRAVAAEAGVRNGLVNYYFRSRDELVHHALTLALDRARADVRRAHERTRPGECEGLLELIGNGTAMTALRMRLVLHGRLHADLQREIEELFEAYVEIAQRALSSSGSPCDRALARLVLAALDGLAVQQLVDGRSADRDAAIARLETTLAGLLPPPARGDGRHA